MGEYAKCHFYKDLIPVNGDDGWHAHGFAAGATAGALTRSAPSGLHVQSLLAQSCQQCHPPPLMRHHRTIVSLYRAWGIRMRKIHKYRIADGPIEIPRGFKLLKVALQRRVCCLWAEVDTDAPIQPTQFAFLDTGSSPPSGPEWEYVETVDEGGPIYHIYMRR